MSRTHIPNIDAPRADLSNDELDEIVNNIRTLLQEAQGDSDKAGEIESVCYYDGLVDAFQYAFDYLTKTGDNIK